MRRTTTTVRAKPTTMRVWQVQPRKEEGAWVHPRSPAEFAGESQLATLPNTLKAMQEAVGGYIELVYLHNDHNVAFLGSHDLEGLRMVVNEEGRLIDLPVLVVPFAYPRDVAGPYFIAREASLVDERGREEDRVFIDLTDRDVALLRALYSDLGVALHLYAEREAFNG